MSEKDLKQMMLEELSTIDELVSLANEMVDKVYQVSADAVLKSKGKSPDFSREMPKFKSVLRREGFKSLTHARDRVLYNQVIQPLVIFKLKQKDEPASPA